MNTNKMTQRWIMGLIMMVLAGTKAWGADPQLTIPALPQAPVIDGKVNTDEWRYAAAVTGLIALEATPQCIRSEQAVFYMGRYADDIYIAMKGRGSKFDQVLAKCAMRDNRFICGDDAVELMIAPGTGKEMEDIYFPTYYIIVNAIGTVFDEKLRENANEMYISWNIAMDSAVSVEGDGWECELRLPIKGLALQEVTDGTRWRMNFTRSHAGYCWSPWVGGGGLETRKIGGDVTFDSKAPAIRLLSVQPLIEGRLGVRGEVANATGAPQTIRWTLEAGAIDAKTGKETPLGTAAQTVTVKPGETQPVDLGQGEALAPRNKVVITARDQAGAVLFHMERLVIVPAPKFTVMKAPPQKMVYVNCRYLPSLERLAVYMNGVAWAKNNKAANAQFQAEIKIMPKGGESAKPVLKETFTNFVNNEGTCRMSMEKLPEGDYSVLVTVADSTGKALSTDEDWFIKKKIPYLTTDRRGVVTNVPAPFTALETAGREIKPWGRVYRFGDNGLPEQVMTQGREVLASPARLAVMKGKETIVPEVTRPFAVTKNTAGLVETKTELKAADIGMTIVSSTEYDGLTRYKLTYWPMDKRAQLDRMVIEIPLKNERALVYSAASDFLGLGNSWGVLSTNEGVVYDSLRNTQSVAAAPPFATLFWVGDYDVSFCYCADTDEGWVVDDTKPEVEAERKGDTVILRLNLVSRPYELTKARTLEFGLQAGPVKPLPEDWRAYQFIGVSSQVKNTTLPDGLRPWGWFPGYGIYAWGLGGGTHLIHPGDTPEQRAAVKEGVLKAFDGNTNIARVGYSHFPMVPQGRLEAKVYRGEWGITKSDWDTSNRAWFLEHYKVAERRGKGIWDLNVWGDDKDMHVSVKANTVTPSLVDFYVYCWDETVKALGSAGEWGFYFDQGYPNPVFDPELGWGYVREDGRKCYSSGLWLYRDLMKRLAYVNFQHNIPNYLDDGQHLAHAMPAYGFCGILSSGEGGFNADVMDKYKTIEGFVAKNPSKQMGMIPVTAMSPARGYDKFGFAWETRENEMLAMLHDHFIGGWGGGDYDIIHKLDAYRNKLIPWRPDVRFMGYWENGAVVNTGNKDLKASFYTCPRGALLIFGNVSTANIESVITVDWAKLGFDFAKSKVTDAEDPARRLTMSPDGKLTLFVPTRGLRLIAVEPK